MDWKQNRLLELAGIKRRRTPDHILFEGDDEGGDDPFAGDDGGDDEGGDDLFGDDEGDEGGDDDSGGDSDGSEEGDNRIPPENLKPDDIKKFGSPRFLDVETKVSNMFNNAFVSASVGAQELEAYPGNAIKEAEPTPAKEEEPEKDEAEDKDKNESFYRFGNKRDKWLIREASRLLTEAETEGAAADEFDMESFCNELANYMDNIHNTEDIEAGIFNMGRQMVLNNFGQDTETEFINMLSSVSGDKYSFLQTGFEGGNDTPVAVGATDGGGA